MKVTANGQEHDSAAVARLAIHVQTSNIVAQIRVSSKRYTISLGTLLGIEGIRRRRPRPCRAPNWLIIR